MDMLLFNGTLKTGPYAHMSAEEKFWSQVDKSDHGGCWIWKGHCYSNGYGDFDWKANGYLAHRVSYFFANGELPDSLCVCHRCDNPPCVNPSHLFLGTHMDNVSDKIRKGRGRVALGEGSGKTFLSDQDASEIKWLLANTTLMHKEIARMYNVPNANTISRIKSGSRWPHVAQSNTPPLWYLAEICTQCDISLADVAGDNLIKLFDRAQRGAIQGNGDNR